MLFVTSHKTALATEYPLNIPIALEEIHPIHLPKFMIPAKASRIIEITADGVLSPQTNANITHKNFTAGKYRLKTLKGTKVQLSIDFLEYPKGMQILGAPIKINNKYFKKGFSHIFTTQSDKTDIMIGATVKILAHKQDQRQNLKYKISIKYLK